MVEIEQLDDQEDGQQQQELQQELQQEEEEKVYSDARNEKDGAWGPIDTHLLLLEPNEFGLSDKPNTNPDDTDPIVLVNQKEEQEKTEEEEEEWTSDPDLIHILQNLAATEDEGGNEPATGGGGPAFGRKNNSTAAAAAAVLLNDGDATAAYRDTTAGEEDLLIMGDDYHSDSSISGDWNHNNSNNNNNNSDAVESWGIDSDNNETSNKNNNTLEGDETIIPSNFWSISDDKLELFNGSPAAAPNYDDDNDDDAPVAVVGDSNNNEQILQDLIQAFGGLGKADDEEDLDWNDPKVAEAAAFLGMLQLDDDELRQLEQEQQLLEPRGLEGGGYLYDHLPPTCVPCSSSPPPVATTNDLDENGKADSQEAFTTTAPTTTAPKEKERNDRITSEGSLKDGSGKLDNAVPLPPSENDNSNSNFTSSTTATSTKLSPLALPKPKEKEQKDYLRGGDLYRSLLPPTCLPCPPPQPTTTKNKQQREQQERLQKTLDDLAIYGVNVLPPTCVPCPIPENDRERGPLANDSDPSNDDYDDDTAPPKYNSNQWQPVQQNTLDDLTAYAAYLGLHHPEDDDEKATGGDGVICELEEEKGQELLESAAMDGESSRQRSTLADDPIDDKLGDEANSIVTISIDSKNGANDSSINQRQQQRRQNTLPCPQNVITTTNPSRSVAPPPLAPIPEDSNDEQPTANAFKEQHSGASNSSNTQKDSNIDKQERRQKTLNNLAAYGMNLLPPACIPCVPPSVATNPTLASCTEPSPFALTPEEQNDEGLMKEKLKALLTRSALGRSRKLDRVTEDKGKQDETIDPKSPSNRPINRLAYDLDSKDIDKVPIPETLPCEDSNDLEANLLSQLQKPPNFEAKFGAAVMEHMMTGEGNKSNNGINLVEIPVDSLEEAPKGTSSIPKIRTSEKTTALHSYLSYIKSFGVSGKDDECHTGGSESPINERTCIGHRSKSFGLAFSPCGTFIATASEDSTVKIWNADNNQCVDTLSSRNKEYQCFKVAWASPAWGSSCWDRHTGSLVLASAGSDNIVRLWEKSDAKKTWNCIAMKDHNVEPKLIGLNPGNKEHGEEPQIYALQFIDQWQDPSTKMIDTVASKNYLLTSCGAYVYILEICKIKINDSSNTDKYEYELAETVTFSFQSDECANGGVSFRMRGGEWCGASGSKFKKAMPYGYKGNANHLNYVFDASYSATSGLLGVALSDETFRLVNSRGVCMSIISLPGCESHITSFSFNSDGTRLVSCIATGHIVLWQVDSGKGQVQVNCTSVLSGGHEVGRPIFGAKFFGGTTENLLFSWGTDGRVCLWDSASQGETQRPIATLVSKAGYPIYALDLAKVESQKKPLISRIALGGGYDEGLLGVPIFIYDIKSFESDAAVAD